MFGEDFPLEPRNYFYTWLYISALSRYPEYIKKLICYDSFTDIEFNPKKSLNCQAMAVAMCVGLLKAGKYEEATQRKEKFLHIVYGEELLKDWKQMTFDRFMVCDITGIEFELTNDDYYTEHYNYYVDWTSDNEYHNDSQVSYVSKDGHLYITIAKNKSTEDFFDLEEINDEKYSKYMKNFYWNMLD